MFPYVNTVTCLSVTIDGVWIGNRIYCILRERNYKQLRQSRWAVQSEGHCNYSTHEVFSVFTNRCLVAVSKADVPLPLGSRTVPGLNYKLLTSHNCSSQLTQSTTELLILVIWLRHGPLRQRLLHYCVFSRCRSRNLSTELFPSSGCTVAYFAMGLHVLILLYKLQHIFWILRDISKNSKYIYW
jgi:hypothetical protein